jgi:hypothetical protein
MANITIIGNNSGDEFGSAITVGNVNSDVYDDIIVGAPGGDGFANSLTDAGDVVVIFGNITLQTAEDLQNPSIGIDFKTFYGGDLGDSIGYAVAGGSDFNGDGIEDIAFSARHGKGSLDGGIDHGEVYVIYWHSNISKVWNLNVLPANLTIYGAIQYDYLGYNSVMFGNIDNDSYADLVISAYGMDGQSGTTPDSGATYVIYGRNYSMPGWDLAITSANVTIYSTDAFDESGTFIDTFDWNDDGFDDIIITVPFGDGPSDNYLDVGDVVIINGSPMLPSTMNIQSAARGFFFFGADTFDAFGQAVAHGDINGDSIQDMAVFAMYADGFNNSNISAGEVYVILGTTSKIPMINSLKINNSAVPLGAMCYSTLKPYQFEVNITAPLGFSDLKNVTMVLDPLGINLVYNWDRGTDTFMEMFDPNGYAEIVSTAQNSTHDNDKNWTISFNIEFDWTCPRVSNASVILDLWNELNFRSWRNYLDVFSVENRLNFTGNLLVTGLNDRILNENDWIKHQEPLNWSGLQVVYEGTNDLYPDITEYEVILWNATDSWSDLNTVTNASFYILTTAGDKSLDTDNYTINITKIPEVNDASNITFTLRLDAENIQFSNAVPLPDVWQNTSVVPCGITATDLGGTMVDASTVQFRTSDDNGTTWSNWTDAGQTVDGTTIDVTSDVQFEEGILNKIQWRGNDTVGNGYSESRDHLLIVDTHRVMFSNPTPLESTIHTSTTVEFGITISDNTSGINQSTIEYAISINNGLTWSEWINLNMSGQNMTLTVSAMQTFIPGINNLVKWRATDVAGNSPTVSDPLRLNITAPTSDLLVYLVNPLNNSEVANRRQTLSWYSNDNVSNVLFDVYLDKDYERVRIHSTSTEFLAKDITENYYLTPELDENVSYYWTVVPRYLDGRFGLSVHGIWNFKVNASIIEKPTITVINPPNGSVQQILTPTFTWALYFKNTVGVRYDIYLGTSEQSMTIFEAGLSTTTYTTPSTKELDNHGTYYWRVKAVGGEIIEPYFSPIWNFNINVTSIILKSYEFTVSIDKSSAILKQGSSKEFSITLINLKNPETIELSVVSELDSSIFSFSENSIALGNNESKSVTLTISIPKDFKTGIYTFRVKGEMTVSGDIIPRTTGEVTLEVKSKGGTTDGDSNLTLIIAAVSVIIIIIILILVLLLMKRKKKPEDEAAEEGRAEPEPEELREPAGEDIFAGMEPELEAGIPAAEAIPGAPPIETEVPPDMAVAPVAPAAAPAVPPVAPAAPPVSETAVPLPEEPAVPVPSEGEPETAPVPSAPAGVTEEPPLPSDLPSDAYQAQPPAPSPPEPVTPPPEGAPPPVQPQPQPPETPPAAPPPPEPGTAAAPVPPPSEPEPTTPEQPEPSEGETPPAKKTNEEDS